MRRRLGPLLVVVALLSIAAFVLPAAAAAAPATHTAGDHDRSLWSLLALVPWAVVAGWLAAVLIPYVSAKLTASRASQWTGGLTAILALVDGFLSTLATQGEHLDVRAALAASFGSWIVATKWHTKVLSGTDQERRLHESGPQLGKAT